MSVMARPEICDSLNEVSSLNELRASQPSRGLLCSHMRANRREWQGVSQKGGLI